MIPFDKLRVDYHKQANKPLFQGRLLSLDPGETTGWGVFDAIGEHVTLTEVGQLDSNPIEAGVIRTQALIESKKPTFLVYEQYLVYSWKSASHSWATLHTPKLIGAIELARLLLKLPATSQMAQQAKQFCTDEKLHEWGYYQRGQKHARDACRHACYWLMFGNAK